jgi:hypothetical protein
MLAAAAIVQCRGLATALAAGAAAPPNRFFDDRWRLPRDAVTCELVAGMCWFYFRSESPLKYEKYHRATQLVLAIEAWKLDHGRLPDSLDQLTGKYIERLPVDPYDGRQFGYYPKGTSKRLEWNINYNAEENLRVIEPGQPFVGWWAWTGGSGDTNAYDRDGGMPNRWGWVFPIPMSGENPRAITPTH